MKTPIIFDGHNDTLLNLYRPSMYPTEHAKERSFFEQSTFGHIDLPRAQQANFGGGFFAIYVPAPEESKDAKVTINVNGQSIEMPAPIDTDYALHTTQTIVKMLFDLEDESQGQVKVVQNTSELTTCLATGVLAAILHFEGAEAIDADLKRLEDFYRQGLRSLGITWSRSNAFGHGVPFVYNQTPDTGEGLTAAGKELVKACNWLGIMIDLSHLNEKGFRDVARISNKPLVATHCGAHALCPKPRNLLDTQLDAIADSSGVIGVTFYVGDLRPDGQSIADTPLSVLADHIDYLVQRLGIDHVALGSDFDGAEMSREMTDVTGLPKLIDHLHQRGYDPSALQKICSKNWLRVLGQTWQT